jgi:outer membrane protein W
MLKFKSLLFSFFLLSLFQINPSYAEVSINAEPYFVGGISLVKNYYGKNVDEIILPNNVGAGFVGVGAFFSDKVAFEMTARYSPTRNKLDNSGGSNSINSTIFNWDLLYYIRNAKDSQGGNFNAFVLGGLAFVATNVTTQSAPGATSKSVGSSGWGYNAGIGIEYDISNRSALRLDVRYTGLLEKTDLNKIVSGNIGLRFKF